MDYASGSVKTGTRRPDRSVRPTAAAGVAGRAGRVGLVSGGLAVALVVGACSSTTTTGRTDAPPTTAAAGGSVTVTPAMTATATACPGPASCFVSGNVSTVGGGVPGLFKGAWVGTDAYLAYQNSLGGLDGRRFKLITDDDDLSCDTNEADTQNLVSQVIAFTGSFSLFDECGGRVLASHPGVPDVSEVIDPTAQKLPNVFSPQPAQPGGQLGPLLYFKHKYPRAVTKVGVLVADAGTAPAQWVGLKAAMEHVGYRIVYEREFSPFETDYTADVLRMRQAGVQMVSLVSTNDTYGAKLLADMHQQGFAPQVVWGGPAIYSGVSSTRPTIVEDAGGPAVADGVYLEQAQSLYLGQDAGLVPEISTFLHWVHGLYPGFNIDLFTLYGWVSAQLYVDALRKAGPDPTRSSLLAALRTETDFDAGGMIAPADPAGKKPPTCYLLARIENGSFVRVDMPAHRLYRCDGGVYAATGATKGT